MDLLYILFSKSRIYTCFILMDQATTLYIGRTNLGSLPKWCFPDLTSILSKHLLLDSHVENSTFTCTLYIILNFSNQNFFSEDWNYEGKNQNLFCIIMQKEQLLPASIELEENDYWITYFSMKISIFPRNSSKSQSNN